MGKHCKTFAIILIVSLLLFSFLLPISYGLVEVVFSSGFEVGAWDSQWNDNGATTWVRGTSSSPGSPWSPHSGTNMSYAGPTNDGNLISDNINCSGATQIGVSFWYMNDDTEANDYSFAYYNGSAYVTNAFDLGSQDPEDTWLYYSENITSSQYFISNFRLEFIAAADSNEGCFLDDVAVNVTIDTSNHFSAEITQSVSTTWNQNINWNAKTIFSQSLTTTSSIATKSSFNIQPSISLTFSWVVDLLKTSPVAYVADLALAFSTALSVITQWVANIGLSQNIIANTSINLQWNAIALFSQTFTFSWVVDIVQATFKGTNYIADLAVALSTTWNLLTVWFANVPLAQSLATTFTATIQSTFSIVPSLSSTFTFAVEAIRGIASVHYIADLSLTLTTIWDSLLQSNFIINLAQTVTTTSTILTKTAFTISTSLSATFTWITNIIRSAAPVAYIADLAVSVTFTWAIDLIQGLQRTVDLTLTVLTGWNMSVDEPVPLTAIDALAIAILAILCAVVFGFAGPLLMNRRKRREHEE